MSTKTWALVGLIAIVLTLSGCFPLVPGEVYGGWRRTDSYEAQQTQQKVPMKCLFTDCGGAEK